MKLTEAEMRMVFQIESTNQNAALNEIYMTWRYAPNPATKETAEGLLDKLSGKCWQRPGYAPGRRSYPAMTLWLWSVSTRRPDT